MKCHNLGRRDLWSPELQQLVQSGSFSVTLAKKIGWFSLSIPPIRVFPHGLVNVPIKHHPTLGDINSNRYLKNWCSKQIPNNGTLTRIRLSFYYPIIFFHLPKYPPSITKNGTLIPPPVSLYRSMVYIHHESYWVSWSKMLKTIHFGNPPFWSIFSVAKSVDGIIITYHNI